MVINIIKMTEEISEFHKKYDKFKFETPNETRAYIEDAEAILNKYPPQTAEERQTIAKFCSHLGCMVTVFGQDLDNGIRYYHKSIELDPENYDLRWEYYTTLEEIVEDDEYCTPELVQDAIDCLTFCIDYCDTPELKEKHFIHYRYNDLGRVYLAAGDYKKAKECFEKSIEILPNDAAQNQLNAVKKKLGNPIVRFFKRLFSGFRKKR